MKKSAYKTHKGVAFRNYFHGNSKTNGCSFRKVGKAKNAGSPMHQPERRE